MKRIITIIIICTLGGIGVSYIPKDLHYVFGFFVASVLDLVKQWISYYETSRTGIL